MYYVLLVNTYGTTQHVEKCKTRQDALEYISNLPDEHYMVILRNDDFAMKAYPFGE